MSALYIADEILNRFLGLPSPSQTVMEWLKREGISAAVLGQDDPPAYALVVPDIEGRFLFADEAQDANAAHRAIVFMTREADGCPADLIAWSPRYGMLSAWLGRSALLGDAHGFRLDADGALPVHRTPLGWLRTGCQGVVLIDPAAARQLIDLGPLLAEDINHAAEIERLFVRLVPAILTDISEKAAA